ncbi:MAG: hypothetical protein J6X84_01760 [Treponema sp.]|nr:hypothetical protein [Treponema sp.]
MKNKYGIKYNLWFLLCSIIVLISENLFLLWKVVSVKHLILIQIPLVAFIIFFNIHPDVVNKIKNPKLHHCAGGVFLLKLFLFTTAISILIVLFTRFFRIKFLAWIFFIEFIIFWNGITRTYLYSTQMGIKLRVIGAVCGMIPIAHLIVLFKIIQTVDNEIFFETEKEELNEKRKSLAICKTKYPIIMIHGVFFRDFKHFNYWGRIPQELETNGAKIFYGNHESATPIDKAGEELAARIKMILKETGAEKVNIIAHSKGGLDCRYMISKCNMENYVASLTTINTPHRGCIFPEYLMDKKIPENTQKVIAKTYNKILRKMGDKKPDFMSSVKDLTQSACLRFNQEIKDSPLVYYQSVGSIMKSKKSAPFPLNFSYDLVYKFDGRNDGLVGEKSFEWGSNFTFLESKGKRGISHGDMIDLNRENIRGFDVREFYVNLVADLKNRGF